ncbi:MAG: hypothetical protein H6978_05885 [Gammaproteobacteria bacterium]|nr:hypothetical protein [Gammaproteobacteria bacterium]
MSNTRFDIVFTGEISAGVPADTVKANLARLFNANAERIAQMFTGNEVTIKKGVDENTAKAYLAALQKAGAVALIRPQSTPAPATSAAPTAAAPTAPAQEPTAQTTSSSDAGRTAQPPQPISATLAEPGVILVEPVTQTKPEFATDHLSLAEPGVTLVEPATVAAPEYDLGALTLAEPGVTLVEPRPVPPARIDISALSLTDNDT